MPDVFPMILEYSESKLPYPDTSYVLYEVMQTDYTYKQWGVEAMARDGVISLSHTPFSYPQHFLIGVNHQTGELIYISGVFFINSIASDFKLDINASETFIPYLQLTTYRMLTQDIRFVKSKKKHLYFAAYSRLYNKKLIIKVNKKTLEIDDIKIIG